MKKKEEKLELEREFRRLLLTGKYTQQEIADKLGVSRPTVNIWVNNSPTATYLKVRKQLAKELERLSKSPRGNETLIFNYIQNLNLLDTMIRRAKYLPNLQPL